MAYSKTLLIASLALTLFLVTTPQGSDAQVQVQGTIYCSAMGNPDPACGGMQCPPLSGALVDISCNDGNTSLGQALTNATGTFDVRIPLLALDINDSLSGRPTYGIYVKPSVGSCDALPPSGVLSVNIFFFNGPQLVVNSVGSVPFVTV